MKKKEILIIEDNEDNSIIVEKILNYFGFNTKVIPLAQEALQYCKTHLPDLILMDISLPDMDGIELSRQLRTMPNFEKLPIIALTAHARQKYFTSAQQTVLDDYLTKPFLPNDLINIVNKYLQQKDGT